MIAKDDKQILTLTTPYGETEKWINRGVFETMGNEYIALQSLDPSDKDVVVLRRFVRYSDDSFEVFDITDEEEFKRAEVRYKELADPMPVEDMVLMSWF